MSKTKTAILIIVIFTFGFFIRAYNLNKDSLILDEAQSVWQASHSVDFIINYSAQNVHLPLHNLLLHFWIKYFGTSEVAVRWLSVIPGVLVLPYVYLLAYQLTHDRNKSLLAFALASFSPFWVWYSREIRMYTFLALFVTMSYYYYVKLLNTGKVRYFILYSLINIIGAYTHYFFLLALLVQGVYFLLSLINGWVLGSKRYKAILATKFVLSWILLLASLSGWVYYYVQHYQGGTLYPSLDKPSKFEIVLSLFNFTFGYQPITVSTLLISLWPLLALFFFLFLTKRKEVFTPNVYLMLLGVFLPIVLVYLVSIVYKPVFLTRYLMASTPLYLILLSWILMQTKGFSGRVITSLAVITFLAANYYQYTRPDIPEKEDYRDAVNYVANHATARDILIASPPYTFFPIQYYASVPIRIDTLPIWDRNALNIPPTTPDEINQDMTQLKAGHKRIYLISTLNLAGAEDVLYYMDHHYTRLYQQKISENVWVSVYQAEYPATVQTAPTEQTLNNSQGGN